MRVITLSDESDLLKLPIDYHPWWVWKREVIEGGKPGRWVKDQVGKLMKEYPDWDPSIVCALPNSWLALWGSWQTMDRWGNLRGGDEWVTSAVRVTCTDDWQGQWEGEWSSEGEWDAAEDDRLSKLRYTVSLAVGERDDAEVRWFTVRDAAMARWLITEAETSRLRELSRTAVGAKGEIGHSIDSTVGWKVYAPFTKWRAGE